MITRPLNLSSRLQAPPRNFDFLFFVNGGLIALFFVLFGSRFVLSPGLSVDFHVPTMPGAVAGAQPTDVVIAVERADMALVEGAVLDFKRLAVWLKERAKGRPGLRLLVQANESLTTRDLTEIYEMARDAGFAGVQVASDSPSAGLAPSP